MDICINDRENTIGVYFALFLANRNFGNFVFAVKNVAIVDALKVGICI